MKLATFIYDGSQRVGLVHASDIVFDLMLAAKRTGSDPDPLRTMLDLIHSGDRALDAALSLLESLGQQM